MSVVIDSPVSSQVRRLYVSLPNSSRDKSWSALMAVILHIIIFLVVGVSLIKPAQFGMDQGLNGVEVNLLATASDFVQPLPAEPTENVENSFIQKQEVASIKPATPSVSKGKDESTFQSKAGVVTEAKPDYLKNPAPSYPDSARRHGQEGLVLLSVHVDVRGHAIDVNIAGSSGYSVLDESARKAVSKWRFRPALLGNSPVESFVQVPVRFSLDKI